jgi:hypothetical protein
MAYDRATKTTILFSHIGGVPATLTFNGSVWTKVSESGSASSDFAMASDESRSMVVLFGANGDTWTWDGTRWSARNPAHAPPGRERGAMAYDPKHKIVVLFGGFRRDGGTAQDMNDTWAWNGEDWTRLG